MKYSSEKLRREALSDFKQGVGYAKNLYVMRKKDIRANEHKTKIINDLLTPLDERNLSIGSSGKVYIFHLKCDAVLEYLAYLEKRGCSLNYDMLVPNEEWIDMTVDVGGWTFEITFNLSNSCVIEKIPYQETVTRYITKVIC